MTTEKLVETGSHVQRAVEQVAAVNGFSKPRLEVSQASGTGDNYIGILFRVLISEAEAEEGDGKRPPLPIIVKTVPTSAKRREMCRTDRIFLNEGNMYNLVLPAYTRLLQEKGLVAEGGGYPDAPKCHFVSIGDGDGSEDVLVLEDMRPLGFAMGNRQEGQDAVHCRFVLSALARLHACSFALQHKDPEEFDKLRSSISEMLFYKDSPMCDFMGILRMRAFEMIAERFPEGSHGYQKAHKFLENFLENFIDLVSENPDGGNVICHGDCWTNNLLFKSNEEIGAPESICLLDFQVARYCPPVLDLIYFLYTCTEKEMRDEHLDSLLRGYHKDLQGHMRALGVQDPDAVYSWERLQDDLRQRGSFGFGMAVFAVAMFLSDKEDVPDMDELFETADLDNPEAMMENFKAGTNRAADINKRVSDVLEEMVERGYM